jgi:hypothetical protein
MIGFDSARVAAAFCLVHCLGQKVEDTLLYIPSTQIPLFCFLEHSKGILRSSRMVQPRIVAFKLHHPVDLHVQFAGLSDIDFQ